MLSHDLFAVADLLVKFDVRHELTDVIKLLNF